MTRRVSVVMPALDEAPNLATLVPETFGALDRLGVEAEIVVVDDGSTDDTAAVLASLRAHDPRLRTVRFRRNVGKSAALGVGLSTARGDVIVLMDADGQDDPSAIAALLDELDRGAELVVGRRARRADRLVKRAMSRVYNAATVMVTRVEGRDFNSGLKAMRREVADALELYGELHRYVPVLAHWAGFRTAEVDVPHRPRLHGRSKFGRTRYWRGLLDLLTVVVLTNYLARPLHLFGGLALLTGSAGGGLLAWMLALRLLGEPVGNRPALLAGILLVVIAAQLASIGVLAELVVAQRRPLNVFSLVAEDSGRSTAEPTPTRSQGEKSDG